MSLGSIIPVLVFLALGCISCSGGGGFSPSSPSGFDADATDLQAKTFYEAGNDSAAAPLFADVVSHAPDHIEADDAQYFRARCA